MDQDRLDEIVGLHKSWLTKKQGGEAADFFKQDLRGLDLHGANLRFADFRHANLAGVDLGEASLEEASFDDANLMGADFSKADLKGASLRKAFLTDAVFEEANLSQADLTEVRSTGANFELANLIDATCRGAFLKNAVFAGADLQEADLSDVTARGANFSEAILADATFDGAIVENAAFLLAEAQGSSWDKASAFGANFARADLQGAWMAQMDLSGTNFDGAILVEANLTESYLKWASAKGANFVAANLENLELVETDVEGADFTGANLVGVDRDALVGAIGYGVEEQIKKRTSYGRAGRAIRKARELDLPTKAATLKKLFPVRYQTIKDDLKGRPVTAEVLHQLVDKYGLRWIVLEKTYESDAQRISPMPNEVILLALEVDTITKDETQKKHLDAIRRLSQQSGHPTSYSASLFPVGWVRFSRFPEAGVLLVEEVQSDAAIVRKGITDEEFRWRMEEQGIKPKDLEKTLDLIRPFIERFYMDALDLVFELAHKEGLEVEMLTYETKKKWHSPQSVYSKLPKLMGMRKRKTVRSPVDEVSEVWHVVPNPRRR